MLYVTPGKYRVSGTGVDLTGITDLELAANLETASGMANGYCTVPNGHDFRGGTVVDEIGTWDMGGAMIPGNRQVYPLHRPLRTITELQIDVTRTQYLDLQANELHLSPDRAEVVSMALTSYGLFGAAIIPNIGLQKPQYRVSYTYGEEIPVVSERLIFETGTKFRAANQWWVNDDVDPVIVVTGPGSAGAQTIDYDEGTVSIVGANVTSVVTATYRHRLQADIARAVTIITTGELGERNMARRGLSGLIELAVGDVRIRRDFPRAGVRRMDIPDRAQTLLDRFRFITVRGT
jgi:hypothetical protein